MTPRLTIILPLKGRHLFTLRFLFHANERRLPYRFLIADGQVHPVLAELLESAGKYFPNLDIDYKRYPDDENYSHFYAKMADAFRRVTTPYAMVADNDDFLAAGGIERAIDFLDRNLDYICSAGRVAGFAVYSGINNPSGGLRGRLNRLYEYYPAEEFASASSLARMLKGGLHLWVYYAVFRSESLAAIGQECAEIDFSDLVLHETFVVTRALTLGKAHVDRRAVGYLRQYGTSSNVASNRDWVHHLLRSRFTSDIKTVVTRISSAVAIADGIPPQIAEEGIRGVLDDKFRQIFSARYSSRQWFKQLLLRRSPVLLTWWQHRPRWFLSQQRATMLRRLAGAGAPQSYLDEFRSELDAIEALLRGPTFENFIRPYRAELSG